MLLPKRVKYRRQHRPKTTGRSKAGNYVTFGEYGLQATTTPWITSRQIESARIAMSRYTKRGGIVWNKVCLHTAYTNKPLKVRMGAGKGADEGWIAVANPGRILFEVAGVNEEVAREALRLASHKLPVKTKFVKREELGGETNES